MALPNSMNFAKPQEKRNLRSFDRESSTEITIRIVPIDGCTKPIDGERNTK
jgi:hypothetical protein